MAKYSNTKAKINEKIATNGRQAVTGVILNDVLQTMVDSLGADYQFGGLVQPGSSFTAGEQPVVFLATTPGTYTNFGGLVVADGEVALLVWSGTAWSKQTPDIATRTEVSQLGQKINIFGKVFNGYINNNYRWDDLDSPGRKYAIVELPTDISGTSFKIVANAIDSSVIAFLSEYNPVEDAAAGVLAYYAIAPNGTQLGQIPTGTKYIYCLAVSGTNRLPQQFVIGGIDITKDVSYISLGSLGLQQVVANGLQQVSNNLTYRVWSLGKKPNVDTTNNTLTFSAATTLTVGTTDFSIPANTVVSLIAPGGTAYSTIVYNKTTGVFSAIGRATDVNFSKDYLLIGFAVTGGADTAKRYYFPFSFTIDGKDVETLSDSVETLADDIEFFKDDYYGQGYINNGIWTDIGQGGRYYYCIPIYAHENSSFEIQYNASADSVLYFLSQNNPVSGQSASAVSYAMIGTNTTVSGTVPTGAKYLYMLAESGGSRMPQKIVIDEIDYLKPIKESLTDLGYIVNNYFSGNSILSLNPESDVKTKIGNLKIGYVNYGVSDDYPPVVSLLHFSDLHNNNINLLRIAEFVSHYDAKINDVIQTGDLVGGVITDKVPASWASVGADWLSVIGNHDATIRENNLWVTVPAKDSYDEIIAPYVANWGVVQPAGAGQNDYYPCYYYKDYADSNLRLIVLDNMQSMNGGPTHWDNTQKTWFESVLTSARTNGLDVIVAVHYPPFFMTHDASNPFDSISVRPTDNPAWFVSPEIPTAVKNFIDAGGNFVCYLCGHTHADYFGVAQSADWNNQLAIGVASASNTTGSIYNDGDRTSGTKGQDCFNIIGIDTQSKTIKLVRIGLEYDKYMRRKNTLCWDYANSQLIYKD